MATKAIEVTQMELWGSREIQSFLGVGERKAREIVKMLVKEMRSKGFYCAYDNKIYSEFVKQRYGVGVKFFDKQKA